MINIAAFFSGLFNVVIAILLFGIIIVVHEFGHFIVAKLCNVKVNEFAIGMGPKLFGFGKKETKYSLRLLPIGGYCAMEGEDEESDNPRAFGAKKVWQRILIIIAGAVMNLILGFVIIVVFLSFFTKPSSDGSYHFPSTHLNVVDEESSAYDTGLRSGDKIIKIDNRRVFTDKDLIMEMQNDEDGVMNILVGRKVDGKEEKVLLEKVAFEITTDEETDQRYLKYPFSVHPINRTFISTIKQAVKTELSFGVLVWRSLGDLVRGKYGLNELSGPVGVVGAVGSMVGDVTKGADVIGALNMLLTMMALITINVGIFNLLPLPALDGGRLIFLIYEGIFRKPIKPKYEGIIHAVGLILLFGFMIIITFFDISKFFK